MNKLRDIFSSEEYVLGANLKFKNKQAHRDFLSARESVSDSGKPVEVKGISAIKAGFEFGGMVLPVLEETNIDSLQIGPSVDMVPMEVEVADGKQVVQIRRYQTNKAVILETEENQIVSLKITAEKQSNAINISYHLELGYANTVNDVVKSFEVALEVLGQMFSTGTKQDADGLDRLKQTMTVTMRMFAKLKEIENKTGKSFKPAMIGDLDRALTDIESLYLLIVKNKVLRMNAKLTATESSGMTFAPGADVPMVGKKVYLTIGGTSTYEICGKEIVVHLAVLLCNAIITDIKKDEDGTTRVRYGDTESEPMFYSYTGFLERDEADQEREAIMKRKADYEKACTANEYLEQEIKSEKT